MQSIKTLLLTALLVSIGALISGCSMQTAQDSSIPWNRPADWEGQIPGMGTGNTH
jgi:hypothetical protein